jgi:hypothetical protein
VEFLKLRNSLVHGQPDPALKELADLFLKKVSIYVSRRLKTHPARPRVAKAKAFAKALVKARAEVRQLLSFLYAAPLAIASLIKQALWHQVSRIFIIPTLHRDWLRIHGPRPPRKQLKRLVSCFLKSNGRVHSPLAA